jgi:hypothetical protein
MPKKIFIYKKFNSYFNKKKVKKKWKKSSATLLLRSVKNNAENILLQV